MEESLKDPIYEMASRIRSKAIEIKWFWEIHDCIASHADAINQKRRYGHVFGLFQISALDEVVLKLCLIWGRETVAGHKQDCLLSLVTLLKRADPRNKQPLKDFLHRHGVARVSDDEIFSAISTLIKNFKSSHQHLLNGVQKVRDARVAHSDAMLGAVSLPALGNIHDLIIFAYDLSSAVLLSCVNVHSPDWPLPLKTEGYLADVLRKLDLLKDAS
jgi:hypothetical protein